MNKQSEDDWARLVRKTRRRPLMWRPGVFDRNGGTLIRTRWTDLVIPIVVGLGLGIPITWEALQPNADMKPLLFVLSPFCLLIAVSSIVRSSSMFVRSDSDELVVRYGFRLFATRLILSRRDVVVDYCVGSDTNLAKSLHGFKFILLRHARTNEVAHVGFALVSDDALIVFDALSRLLGAGHNYTQAVITLHDGSLIRVDRLATWAAGKWRNYTTTLTQTDSRTIQLSRRAFGKNRNVADTSADVYPVQIESQRDGVRIRYSNNDERSVPDYDCVAVQVCKEEIAQRHTRYEVNLITDSSTTERLNLASVDIALNEHPKAVWNIAKTIGELLELEVVDHIS